MVEEPDAQEKKAESATGDDVSPDVQAEDSLRSQTETDTGEVSSSDTAEVETQNAETPAFEAPDAAAQDSGTSAIVDDEPLPEWEELTPEYFEDECLRNDFMLRWAAVLLAVLFGWNYVTDSSVLVQIKSGELIAENGFLPLRTDPLAVATEGLPWVNLHWLADLKFSLLYRFGGFEMLTVLTSLKVGFSFWLLSLLVYRNVSTWWASICSVVAIVALFPGIQPGGASVTILGWAVLLYLLFVWKERPQSSLLWGLVPLLVFWANSDSRAWTGMLFLLVFVVAEAIRKAVSQRQLLIAGIAIVAAILIHPWPLQPALGFQDTLANAAQARQEGLTEEFFPRYAYGLLNAEFWQSPDVFVVANAMSLGLSFIALLLSLNQFNAGLTAGWVAVNVLTLFFGELVPYAAIVNCSVASLQGQTWYRERFKVDYSVDWWPVLIARTGRAATVAGFFLVAYAGVNGGLTGPQGKRIGIGMGLDPRLENRLESTEDQLLPGIYGDRVFNVRADQGDMLIWLGKMPYIDSRHSLFVNAETDFAERHREIRTSIFSQGPLVDDDLGADISWGEEFAEKNIQSLILRLWGPNPAYSPFMMLIGTRAWPMTGFGAAGAVFTRGDLEAEDVRKHIDEHVQTGFMEQAYRKERSADVIEEPIQIWPRPASSYDQWLVQKLKVTPNEIQLARHYIAVATRLQQTLTLEQGMAISELAIRAASAGLSQAPDDADAYRVLVDAQSLVEASEQRFLQINGANYPLRFRNQQVLCQAFHAVKASHGAPVDLQRLFMILLGQQSIDIAERIADQYFEQTGKRITETNEEDQAAQEQGAELLQQIEDLVLEVKSQIEAARTESAPLPQLAGIAINGNCPGLALSILEEDMTLIASDPGLQLTYASLLLANGRTEDAWEQLEGMQSLVDQAGAQNPGFVTQWRDVTATANLAANVPDRAADLYAEEAVDFNENSLRSLIFQPPAAAAPAPSLDIWPTITLSTHANALVRFPERWATVKLHEALIRIDQGNLEAATQALLAIYEGHPEFSLRSLVAFYLNLLTGETYEMLPPSQWIPVWDGMFAPDEPSSSPSEQMNQKIPKSGTAGSSPNPDSQLPPSPSLPERSE